MSKYVVQVNGKARWFHRTKLQAKSWARRWSSRHPGKIDVVYRQRRKGAKYITIASYRDGYSKPAYMQPHRWYGRKWIKARRAPRRRH